MNDISREDFAKMLKEAYKGVFIGILVFASIVGYIYWSSSYAWEQKQRRLELEAERRAAERIAQISDVGVYAWVNNWGTVTMHSVMVGPNEYREAQKLEVGTEYKVGKLRQFDVNRKTGWNEVKYKSDDDTYFSDPIITFAYNGFIYAKYSIDSDDGWLSYGTTNAGIKTGTYSFVPETENSTYDCDGWGEGIMSVRVPANGMNNLAVNADNLGISESMRNYNYFIDERLGDAYKGVPDEYADRTRRIWTSHLIVEVYKEDPHAKGAEKRTPELTFKIRIRNYGVWELTDKEYDGLVFAVPALTERDYAPRMTIEIIP